MAVRAPDAKLVAQDVDVIERKTWREWSEPQTPAQCVLTVEEGRTNMAEQDQQLQSNNELLQDRDERRDTDVSGVVPIVTPEALAASDSTPPPATKSSPPGRRSSSLPPPSATSRRLMRSHLVAPALTMMRRRGHDPSPLLRELGLPASAETDTSLLLPLETLKALLAEVDRRLADPLFAIRLSRAESGTTGAIAGNNNGLVEYLVQTAPTVGDALRVAARFGPLENEVISVEVTEGGSQGLTFRQSIAGERGCLGPQANEAFLATTIEMLRSMTATAEDTSRLEVERAWVAHRRERGTAELAAALGLPIDGVDDDAGSNGITVSSAVADLPLRGSDPRLHSILRDHAELLLAGRATPSRYLGHVRDIIRERLRHELPTLEEVARALRTSARTLQRRLGEEGSSFQELVESVRSESARELLADQRRSVGQVAFELHYADVSGFVRAFRRWTGATPGEFRNQLLAS